MKTLYFTVDKQLSEIDEGVFDATGNKTIVLYEIIDNRPKIICEIESDLENNSIEEINDWLEENGDENLKYVVHDL